MARAQLLFAVLVVLSAAVPAQATITLKIAAYNPSVSNEQAATVKQYLPQEITAADVLRASELELVYDYTTETYYVFGEFMLSPGSYREWDVEMNDVWSLDRQSVDQIEQESAQVAALLAKTEFAERGKYLEISIREKVRKIRDSLRRSIINPQEHIERYRINRELMKQAEQELLLLQSLVSRLRILPTVTAWKLFVGVIVFLGGIALALTAYWLRQARQGRAVAPASAPPLDESLAMEQRGAAADTDDTLLDELS